MDATIVPKMQKHYPVLLKEIISVISPQHGGTFIDCTFGQGGYSKKILDFENTNVIALDRDKESEKIANELKQNFEKLDVVNIILERPTLMKRPIFEMQERLILGFSSEVINELSLCK